MLNDLYGANAFEELVVASAGARVYETAIQTQYGKGVRINLVYTSGATCKFDCYKTFVYWQSLRSGKNIPTGLYTSLVKNIPPMLKARGVKYFLAVPHTDQAESILKTRMAWTMQSNKMLKVTL